MNTRHRFNFYKMSTVTDVVLAFYRLDIETISRDHVQLTVINIFFLSILRIPVKELFENLIYFVIPFIPTVIVIKMSKITHFLYFLLVAQKIQS